jgi:hypothetical protein
MPRKTSLIGAALLTGVIVLSIFLLRLSNNARAEDISPTPSTPSVVMESPAVPTTSGYEMELAQREKELLNQVALREQALAELDATYGEQLTALEERLAATNDELVASSKSIEILRAAAQAKTDEIAATDAAFQDELARLQNGLAFEDAQIRAQIEAAYAQLQQAYDQIAAAQASAAQSASSDDGSVVSQPPAQDDDDDEDDDHDDNDDDDDHDDDDDDDDGDHHEDGDD